MFKWYFTVQTWIKFFFDYIYVILWRVLIFFVLGVLIKWLKFLVIMDELFSKFVKVILFDKFIVLF